MHNFVTCEALFLKKGVISTDVFNVQEALKMKGPWKKV